MKSRANESCRMDLEEHFVVGTKIEREREMKKDENDTCVYLFLVSAGLLDIGRLLCRLVFSRRRR